MLLQEFRQGFQRVHVHCMRRIVYMNLCASVCVCVHTYACGGDVIRERRVANQVQRKLFHVVIPC